VEMMVMREVVMVGGGVCGDDEGVQDEPLCHHSVDCFFVSWS